MCNKVYKTIVPEACIPQKCLIQPSGQTRVSGKGRCLPFRHVCDLGGEVVILPVPAPARMSWGHGCRFHVRCALNKREVHSKESKSRYYKKMSYEEAPESYCEASYRPVSYTHLRAHETRHDLVCRLLL